MKPACYFKVITDCDEIISEYWLHAAFKDFFTFWCIKYKLRDPK